VSKRLCASPPLERAATCLFLQILCEQSAFRRGFCFVETNRPQNVQALCEQAVSHRVFSLSKSSVHNFYPSPLARQTGSENPSHEFQDGAGEKYETSTFTCLFLMHLHDFVYRYVWIRLVYMCMCFDRIHVHIF
jgi:hypothetical protein